MITSFFEHLTVGGVARPVDTVLMAGLILYSATPFEKAVKSKTRQLAYVFQVRLRHRRQCSSATFRHQKGSLLSHMQCGDCSRFKSPINGPLNAMIGCAGH